MATGSFSVTAATLAASLIASALVRETFGYSFSTWRLHLRGETIRSAHDVGRVRSLTAGRMMRKDLKTIAADVTVEEFRRQFPLGSTKRVIVLDGNGRYGGIVRAASAYGDAAPDSAIGLLATEQETWLTPSMSIQTIMAAFDRSEADELAVLDEEKSLLGLVSEAYAIRRYAEELEKSRRDLTGEA